MPGAANDKPACGRFSGPGGGTPAPVGPRGPGTGDSGPCSCSDGLVRWESCIDDAARVVEVPGRHLPLLTDAAPLHAVAEPLPGRPRHLGDDPVGTQEHRRRAPAAQPGPQRAVVGDDPVGGDPVGTCPGGTERDRRGPEQARAAS